MGIQAGDTYIYLISATESSESGTGVKPEFLFEEVDEGVYIQTTESRMQQVFSYIEFPCQVSRKILRS